MSSGCTVVSKEFFYSADAGYYNCDLEKRQVGLKITMRPWESSDNGIEFDKIITQHFGWKEDVENGKLIGFPIEHAQSIHKFHFPGCIKGEIPFEFLRKRYEILTR